MTTEMLGNGVYSLSEAARLTGLPVGRVREWFGRSRMFQGDFQRVDGDRAISFFDLIDVFVAGQLREHGVSLQKVRKVYSELAREMRTDHPFCRTELLSDGKDVFSRFEEGELLVDVLSKQGFFSKIILPFLKSIEYDANHLARRWKIADRVVIDPEICYGAPIVESVAVPTSVLAKSYAANGRDAAKVADFYGVNSKDVMAAVNFESGLAA